MPTFEVLERGVGAWMEGRGGEGRGLLKDVAAGGVGSVLSVI